VLNGSPRPAIPIPLKIIAMYGRGMSVRDIQAHLRERCGVEVGDDLISRVTDAVLDDVREWQARPLEDLYPILFLDALIVKVRDAGAVRKLACYVAIGVNLEGERDVLGTGLVVVVVFVIGRRPAWCGSQILGGAAKAFDNDCDRASLTCGAARHRTAL
jgi:Transposase, Mutator family